MRKHPLAAILLCCAPLAAAPAYAQEQPAPAPPPVITTDRPAITDASTVVPSGEFVFENGFTETGNQGQQGFDFPETLIRFGVTSKTELRFAPPDYFQNYESGAGVGSGWGDLSFGVKQQLIAAKSFDASAIVSLSAPTGAHVLSSHGYDPSLQFPWSYSFAKNWTAAGMLSVLWPTEGMSRNRTGQASFYIDRQLTTRVDAFVEYAGEFAQRGGPQNIVHAGGSFKLTNNQQLDFHAGFGLSSAAPGHFIGVGYSFQFQALHRGEH